MKNLNGISMGMSTEKNQINLYTVYLNDKKNCKKTLKTDTVPFIIYTISNMYRKERNEEEKIIQVYVLSTHRRQKPSNILLKIHLSKCSLRGAFRFAYKKFLHIYNILRK